MELDGALGASVKTIKVLNQIQLITSWILVVISLFFCITSCAGNRDSFSTPFIPIGFLLLFALSGTMAILQKDSFKKTGEKTKITSWIISLICWVLGLALMIFTHK